MTRSMRMAYVKAYADYTDDELLEKADYWCCRNPELAWEWREAWAIRCVEGKHVPQHVDECA